MSTYLILSIVVGLVALGVAVMLSNAISAANAGTARMKEIAGYIHEGAMAFLYREYKYLAIFIVVVAAIIATFLSVSTALCFIGGAVFSICAGYLGMNVATKANVRTAEAARHGMSEALKIAFSGGAVMGLGVVGLGIAGLSVAYFVFDRNIDIVTGFGLGASSIALFARVGGGIYTKAADVGADLVGKVEAGIPEDDPRNPATIADNVGDNVGDVAGMGADLFESYVGAIISALTLGAVAYPGGEGVEFAGCCRYPCFYHRCYVCPFQQISKPSGCTEQRYLHRWCYRYRCCCLSFQQPVWFSGCILGYCSRSACWYDHWQDHRDLYLC